MIKWLRVLLFLFIIFLFCYFRIILIINQNLPYTYDQGRDFLKAEEIVRYKNPTFIGPTTGIMGIYHGAWWYYFLAIPYIIFNGNPIGFYWFLFIFTLIITILFIVYIENNFDFLTGLFFLIVVAASPYLISTSVFPISSVFVIPFLLFLFYSTFHFFKTKKNLYQYLIFLNLGFILEAEIPFGLFLIPSYFISLLITGWLKYVFDDKKNFFYSLLFFLLPLSLRILFELKNNFVQTKNAFNFIFQGKLHNPHSFYDTFKERLVLFINYYNGLFDQKILGYLILFLLFFITIFFYKKIDKEKKEFFKFNLILLITLFFTSLIYRDNFWPNYFEGLSYFYLLILLVPFFISKKLTLFKKKEIFRYSILFFLSLNLFLNFYQKVNEKKGQKYSGLATLTKIIEYLYQKNKNNDFCLKIYTPPVIPYTYDYLLSYYNRVKKLKFPKKDFISNECWYIVENDQYQFRIDKWREENIPIKAALKDGKKIGEDVVLELWSIKNN